MAINAVCSILMISSLFGQGFSREKIESLSKKSTRYLIGGAEYGAGGLAVHRFGRPAQANFVLGLGLFSASDFRDQTINGAVYAQRGILLPVRLGIRNELLREELPALDWAVYWVSTAGPVLAFGFPYGADFQTVVSNTTFGLGGEVYTALGLEAIFGVGLALYLEGGAYAMNAFASRSLLRQANYFGPSLAFGIRTAF